MFKAEKKKSLTQLNLPVILWAVLVTHKWKNSKSAYKASTVAFLRFYTFFIFLDGHPTQTRVFFVTTNTESTFGIRLKPIRKQILHNSTFQWFYEHF